MRLLFVCPDMDTGGAQSQWAALARGLAERGVPLRLLALRRRGPLYDELEAEGIDVRFAGMARRADPAGLRRVLAAAEPRPSLVVVHGVSPQFVGLLLARRSRAPLLMTEHTPLVPDGSLIKPRPHQRALIRLVARAVDRVVAVASQQVEPLASLGYRRDRIAVIPNGVFPERLQPRADREATRSALGLGEDDFAAIAVSALRPEKRLDVFIRAVSAARERDPRVRGFVAGEGRDRARLEELLRETGAEVRLLGTRGDVPDLMSAADAVCLTSDAEALPMAILEAMALARPVVATEVGGTRDAVAPGVTGLLARPGDAGGVAEALLALAADPTAAARMGEAGQARQREHFGGEGMVTRYLRLFEESAR